MKKPNVFFVLAACICVAWLIARVYDLNGTPNGFYIDEAVGAAHISCIAEDLHDVNGNFAPLIVHAFKHQAYSGTHHFPFVYPAALWSKIFGISKLSFKLFVSLANIAALVLLFAFLYKRYNPLLAICVLLSICLSPWSFHYSRVFWDPSLFPAYLITALCLSQFRAKRYVVISAACFALAIYTYPPAKLAIPAFLGACLIVWMALERRLPPIGRLGLFVGIFMLCLIPQIGMEFSGTSGKRFELVGFTHPEYIKGYHDSLLPYVSSFFDKWLLHFSAKFLFFSGDGNLRHSVSNFGMLSWMDLAILFASVLTALGLFIKDRKIEFNPEDPLVYPLLVSLVGIATFSLPAALTWEGLPHATRVIGVWPFYGFVFGFLLYGLYRLQPAIGYSILLVGVIFSYSYLSHYWGEYRLHSQIWYDQDQERVLLEGSLDSDWQKKMKRVRYEPEPVKYYITLLADCETARAVILKK